MEELRAQLHTARQLDADPLQVAAEAALTAAATLAEKRPTRRGHIDKNHPGNSKTSSYRSITAHQPNLLTANPTQLLVYLYTLSLVVIAVVCTLLVSSVANRTLFSNCPWTACCVVDSE